MQKRFGSGKLPMQARLAWKRYLEAARRAILLKWILQ